MMKTENENHRGQEKARREQKPQSPKETLAWLHGSILQTLNKAKEKDFNGTCPLEGY